MRSVCVLAYAGWVALSVAAMPVAAQSASFEIAQNGHAVGTASFKFTPTAQGVDSSALVKVSMEGLDYALSKDERLTSADQLEHAQLNAIVNGQAVNVIVAPDAAQMLLNISANGRSSTTRLAAHADTVLLADFDPGGLETLLHLAATKGNGEVWAILPKQAGSIEPVKLATYPDQQGTLEGKPITVHHVVATIAGANTDLFWGPENQLLQADLPQPGFALVRKSFVLKPPARPEVPMGAEQSAPPAN